MAQLQVNLSGLKGLAPLYYGDKPFTTSAPARRYLGTDGQLAEGVFNPLSRFGYISPSNNTTKAVTGTTGFLLTSAYVSAYQLATDTDDAIFFADEATTGTAGKIMNLDTAVDTSLDTAATIAAFSSLQFRADCAEATDLITLFSGTLAEFEISNGSQVTYTSTTFGGLTQNTTYYVGSISGVTFKLYTDAGLSSLVDITNGSSSGALTFVSLLGSTKYTRSEDMILYQKNGVPTVYYTRVNTTGGGWSTIGVAAADFSTTDDDWSGTLPTGKSFDLLKPDGRIVFILADNSYLYVLNGNVVHKIDGTTDGGSAGTITSNVLAFLGSSSATGTSSITRLIDGIDMKGFVWLGVHVQPSFDTDDSSITLKTIPMSVGVYMWDRQTTTVSNQSFVYLTNTKEIKSLHKFQGVPSCFTISMDGYTEFRVWNGNTFKVAKRLGKNAYPAYRRHSVHEMDDYIMWLGNDGKVYMYGIIEPGLDNSLYIIGDMTSHVTGGQTYSGSGVFVAANATETVTSGLNAEAMAFYLSYTDTGGNHLKKWYPFGYGTVASVAQVGHSGDVYSLVTPLPQLATLKSIDISCLPNGSAGDTTTVATLKFYANQSSTPFATKTVTRGDIAKGYLSYELNKPYVTAFQLEIEWSASQTLGANDFCPSTAVVEYQPTRTRKGD